MGDTIGIKRTGPKSARAVRSYEASAEKLNSAIDRAIRSLKRWRIEKASDGGIEAVRSTRFLRFEDDVRIRISGSVSGSGEKSEAVFESASRVGHTDFGQNRRNLKELLAAVDEALANR